MERRRTEFRVAKRERQAPLRRAAFVRRAVHIEAARSAERLDGGDGLDRSPLRIIDLALNAPFF
jgi:hypothetical protein